MDEATIERMEAQVVEEQPIMGEYPFSVSIRVSDGKYLITARSMTIVGLDERVELLRGWVKDQPGFAKPPVAETPASAPPAPAPTSAPQTTAPVAPAASQAPSNVPNEWTVDAEVQSFTPLLTDGGKLRPKVKCKAGEGMIWTTHGVTAWPDDFWGAAGIDIEACNVGETYTFPANVIGAVVLCKRNDQGGVTPMKVVKFRMTSDETE